MSLRLQWSQTVDASSGGLCCPEVCQMCCPEVCQTQCAGLSACGDKHEQAVVMLCWGGEADRASPGTA